MINLISFIISLSLGFVFIPMLSELLIENNLTEYNYKNIKIPTAMGLAFIFAQIINFSILSLFYKYDSTYNLYLLGFVFIGLLGYIDDTIGNDKYKGFKGHIGAFLKGELTTGNIKALLGFLICFLLNFKLFNNPIMILLNTFILSLSTNTLNLMDLRPGRAIKFFIFFSLPSLLWILSNKDISLGFLSILGIIYPYFKMDIKSKIMMGDTGSNILGYNLGFFYILNENIFMKTIILILLIFIQIISEKKSISKIIEENSFLNFIDMLGRR